MHYAVNLQNLVLEKILLNNHADINIKNNEGKTVIDYAASNSNKQIMNILLNPSSLSVVTSTSFSNSPKIITRILNNIKNKEDFPTKEITPPQNHSDLIEYLYPHIGSRLDNYKMTKALVNLEKNVFKYHFNNIELKYALGFYSPTKGFNWLKLLGLTGELTTEIMF